MSVSKPLAVDDILRRRTITQADVAALRRAYADAGEVSAEEADTLLVMNELCAVETPAWKDFFLEALCEYVVHQLHPDGYMTTAKAVWLVSRISRDARVGSRAEFELLLAILDSARWVPVSLVRFALDQIANAVREGQGPLRVVGASAPGTITEEDVETVRRLLCAFESGNVPITRQEAEALFEINDAAANGAGNPAWTMLFVAAITGAALAVSGCSAPPRRELVSCREMKGLAALQAKCHKLSIEEAALARLEQQRIEIITGEKIASLDAAWLAERIGSNNAANPNKYALLVHLADLGTGLDPALQAILTRFHHAA